MNWQNKSNGYRARLLCHLKLKIVQLAIDVNFVGSEIYSYLLNIQHGVFVTIQRVMLTSFSVAKHDFELRSSLEMCREFNDYCNCFEQKTRAHFCCYLFKMAFLSVYFLLEKLANVLNWNRISLNWKFKSYKEYMFADE